MKRLFHILPLVVAFFTLLPLGLSAQTQDNALYVYRNDGDFTAFLREDLDSIVLSHYDADSVYQKECVMQVFYTPDSIYRIPIAAIDSVSLVALPTIINEDVFPLTAEHTPYILRGDTLSFEFNLSTPQSLLPKVGHIVVSSYDCDAFEDGIIGRVLSVEKKSDGIYYKCEKAYMDDVFGQILYTGDLKGDDSSQNSLSRMSGTPQRRVCINWDKEYKLWGKSYEKVLEKGGATTTISARDSTSVRITLRKTNGSPFFAKIRYRNKFESGLKFNAKSTAEIKDEKPLGNTLRVGKLPIPNTYGLLYFVPTLDFYGYFSITGEVELNFSAHLNRTDDLELKYKDGEWSYAHIPNNDAGIDVASLSMEGSAEAGIKASILLGLNGTRTGLGMTAKVGLKESIDCKFDALEYVGSGLYDAIKDSYARTTIPWSLDGFVSVGLLDRNCPSWHTKPLENEPQCGSDKYILPLFTKPQYSKGANNAIATITTNPSRDLLMPVSLGIGMENESGEKVATQWNTVEYQKEKEWTLNGLSESFNGLTSGNKYKAYPYVRILGKELKAMPVCEFEAGKEDGNSDDNIKPADRPYPEGICPDENHPHLIDLGLPSGTKWACCNVGASNPGSVGDYFAWGETAEKKEYTKATYKYHDWRGLVSISSFMNNDSILPYNNDAAYINMGDEWCTPTKAQLQELIGTDSNNVFYNWCSWTGYGLLIESPRTGAKLFLPATGEFYGKDLESSKRMNSEREGGYWSSTPYKNSNDVVTSSPYFLWFQGMVLGKPSNSFGGGVSEQGRLGSSGCEYGRPVRAVAR